MVEMEKPFKQISSFWPFCELNLEKWKNKTGIVCYVDQL